MRIQRGKQFEMCVFFFEQLESRYIVFNCEQRKKIEIWNQYFVVKWEFCVYWYI